MDRAFTDLAGFAPAAAAVVALFGAVAGIIGGRRRDARFTEVARRSLHMVLLLTTLGAAGICVALAGDDFRLAFVARHSERSLPLFYKVTSLWGGQAGSILFWSWILAVYGSLFAVSLRRRVRRPDTPWSLSAVLLAQVFFLGICVLLTNPYEPNRMANYWDAAAGTVQPWVAQGLYDGNGLNPQLRNPSMVFHPPNLYLGLVGMTIPWAIALGALAAGTVGVEWIKRVRRWVLLPWLFLTVGIVLGGEWAYEELGWGGYWAWDPVENASFIPWLTATAFFHSCLVQERRGMLKMWNVVLVQVTFLLAVFGTLLTRGGFVNSVHAFAESSLLTVYFLGFLGAAAVTGVFLIALRWDGLRADRRLESVFSREGAFLLNNWILLLMAFQILFGTLFPTVWEALTGNRITLGPDWYTAYFGWYLMVLLLMMGIGPAIGWRRAGRDQFAQAFLAPFTVACLGTAAAIGTVLSVFGRPMVVDHWVAFTGIWVILFSGACTVLEFHRGARARGRTRGEPYGRALVRLVLKNRRRYGGYLVHAGVLVAAIGIVISQSWQVNRKALQVGPGQTVRVGWQLAPGVEKGGYGLRLEGVEEPPLDEDSDHAKTVAEIAVLRPVDEDPRTGAVSEWREVARVRPEMRFYRRKVLPGIEQPLWRTPSATSEPARLTTGALLLGDLYVVLGAVRPGPHGTQSVELEVFLNPGVNWLWLGVLVVLAGGMLAALPGGRRTPAPRKEGDRGGDATGAADGGEGAARMGAPPVGVGADDE